MTEADKTQPTLMAITVVKPARMEELQTSYDGNEKSQELLSQLSLLPSYQSDHFQLIQGVIKYKNRLYVGSSNDIRVRIIKTLHESPMRGHSGQRECLQRIQHLFYWPGMKGDIIQFIRQCDICQRNKGEHRHYPGLLQPLPIPSQAWSQITMDFVEKLAKSGGFDTVLVVIDRLTKFGHFIPDSSILSITSGSSFIDNVYKLHGLPESIITDRDKVFTSNFWQELFKLIGTELHYSSSYHPQVEGQSERLNQCWKLP